MSKHHWLAFVLALSFASLEQAAFLGRHLVVVANEPSSTLKLELMRNFDGDLSFTGATPEQSQLKLQELIDEVANGPATTLMWSIGAGSDILYYHSNIASTWGWRRTKYDDDPKWKSRIERCRLAIEAGLDAPRIVGERARERGIKFIPSYRMNDAHFTSDPLNYPLTGRFWIEHQDATIGKSPIAGFEGYQHLLNFAHEEVRAYRLAVIFEAIARYSTIMDGFELDFNRFQVFFAPGEAEKLSSLITDMVKQVRERLNVVAAQQGRAMRLVVRVPPAIQNCTWSGLAVAEWMQLRLVDVVIPSQLMTLAHDMPVDEFVKIAAPNGVEVFGSIYGRGGYNWPFTDNHQTDAYASEVTRDPTPAQVLGAMMNQRYLGVTGFQTFNFNFIQGDAAMVTAINSGLTNAPRGDRRYQVTQGYFFDIEDSYEYRKQLPVALQPGETSSLRLLVGEDLTMSTDDYIGLRLGLHGANKAYSNMRLSIVLNGQTLHEGDTSEQLVVTTGIRHGNGSHAPPTEAYVQIPLQTPAKLQSGWNTIEVTLSPASKSKPIWLVEAEIGVLPTPLPRP